MHYAKIAFKIRDQILRFSGELSAGLPKPCRRFIAEMLYGLQARQSVRLTEIGRALQESISLKKTEGRLCRQLRRPGLWERLTVRICRMAASRVHDLTLLILDLSDISKKYARKMEYLAGVHDGSEGGLGTGYWLLQVIGAETGHHSVLPIYNRLYSQKSPDHQSENIEILTAIETVSQATQGKGVWVMDRGGDRDKLLFPLIHSKKRFLFRLCQGRHLIYQGRALEDLEIAQGCPMLYLESIIKEEGEKAHCLRLEFGVRPVTLPGRPEPLSLVVVRGFGEEPLMLLTNVPLKKTRKSLWWAVQSYLTRWTIEETFRFIKQSYQLEDIRLLTYVRLQNMMAFVLAAAYFTMVYLNLRTKLRVLTGHVLDAARRVFGIPDFRFYALADGIKAHLFGQKRGLSGCFSSRDPETGQRWLFSP
jgi:Transposase DDE domain